MLVGHSYGGGVITQAAARALDNAIPIAHLVYLTAFAPNDGESVAGAVRRPAAGGDPTRRADARHDDGTFSAGPADAAVDVFYGHCTPEQAAAAVARLSRQTIASLVQPVAGDPRARIASTYIVCTEDRAIHPNHQRLMAERCGAWASWRPTTPRSCRCRPRRRDILAGIAAR